jgi:hypothetical protein
VLEDFFFPQAFNKLFTGFPYYLNNKQSYVGGECFSCPVFQFLILAKRYTAIKGETPPVDLSVFPNIEIPFFIDYSLRMC